ncbi:MAG TPA: ABC transporter permease subunit [Anaerolineae bacterium]|nr:ABC transporter permease subunit [Anaerolineae bacterium]
MSKIRTIIRKEWMEVFKNRLVIFTVAFLPLLLTAIPLVMLYTMRGAATGAMAESLPGELAGQLGGSVCPSGLSDAECNLVFLISQFMMLFMLIPVSIPVTIAAYSIVGEKATRSLEPLLATPITTLELLVGKCLAAVIPAVLSTYAAYGIFALGAWLIVANKALVAALLDARWLIAILAVGPLMAVMSVTFSLMVSSRVNDPRVAEQVSMVIMLPVLAGFFGQVAGLFFLNEQIVAVVAVIMVAVDALMVYLATRVFQRETILTRWR